MLIIKQPSTVINFNECKIPAIWFTDGNTADLKNEFGLLLFRLLMVFIFLCSWKRGPNRQLKMHVVYYIIIVIDDIHTCVKDIANYTREGLC